MATEKEIDLTGDAPPKAQAETGEPKRGPGRPKGSTSKPRVASGRVEEAEKALSASLKRIADVLEPRAPDFAETFKRDAPKMAQAVATFAAKRPGMLKGILLLFGPGSLAYAVEAFVPSFLHLRSYMIQRRFERLQEQQAEHPEGFIAPDGTFVPGA